jgi:hypothetical protein
MRLADIMRDIANLLDQREGQDADMSQNSTQQRLTPVTADEPELNDDPVMVPPLQAKLEILKKSEGMPNVYDDESNDEQNGDELVMLKQRAGLSPCQQEAAEDNDIVG